MKPEVIVIGQNSSIILGQVRALGQTGYKVHVLKTSDSKPKRKSYELYSKYISTYGNISKSNEDAFIRLLLDKYADTNAKKVLIPCDDNVASCFDHHCQDLLPYFMFPNINYENGRISFFMNKSIQKELVNQCDLNTPKGWTIEWHNGEYCLPDDIEYPCFVKPEIYHVLRKVLMKRCDNRQELENVMSHCPKDLPMLVEQFIDITQEYGVSGIAVGGNVMITSLIKKVETYLGTTASGTLLPISLYPELNTKLTKFIEMMNYTGIFDIDLYESEGKMYFCECNLRLGNSGVATLLNGINLPSMLVDSLCDKDIELNAPTFNPKSFVDERVFIQKYWSKEISWREYKKGVNKADMHYIKSNIDKKPYETFRTMVLLTRAYKLFKTLLPIG